MKDTDSQSRRKDETAPSVPLISEISDKARKSEDSFDPGDKIELEEEAAKYHNENWSPFQDSLKVPFFAKAQARISWRQRRSNKKNYLSL